MIYENLINLFPLGYNLKLDNVPPKGNVVVLTEKMQPDTTGEIAKEERGYTTTSTIQVYIRQEDSTTDNTIVINDLLEFYKSIKDKEGEKIGSHWVYSVLAIGGPSYLGREQVNALFSMTLRIKYTL